MMAYRIKMMLVQIKLERLKHTGALIEMVMVFLMIAINVLIKKDFQNSMVVQILITTVFLMKKIIVPTKQDQKKTRDVLLNKEYNIDSKDC